MKNLFLLLIAFLPVFVSAQEKDVYDTAAAKLCDYLNAHSPEKIKSQKDAELLFAQGFLETCMPLVDRLLAKEGLKTFDNESGVLIGKKVGLRLAVSCPTYMEIMRPAINDELQKNDNEETGSLQGTVVQILQDGYTFLKIKTSDGTIKRMVWLIYFNEAENLNNNPQKLLNKKVELKWKALKLYYFKSNSFATEKIITAAIIN